MITICIYLLNYMTSIENTKINRTKKLIKRETIEKKLNKMYSNSHINNSELEYDVNVDIEYVKNLSIDNEFIDIDKLSRLPVLNLETCIDEDEEDVVNTINNCSMNEEDDEIDKDSLEKEIIGDIYYYFDYSKGIIYDLQYKIIGSIDEFGEIVLS